MAWWRLPVDAVLSQISDVISDVSGQLPDFSVRTAIRVLSVLGITGSALVRFDVDSYVQQEEPIAKAGLLANIGPDGSRAPGAFPGVVVASPSTVNPNYYYSWRRDSALVFKTIIDQYTSGRDKSLGPLIDDYVAAEAEFQQVSNPSGSLLTGGLGEPKFYVNITAFEGPWGRPQRDGPALRSTAIISYANWLLENGNTTYVNNTLWPVIALDLQYVSGYWNQSTFDLWEEVDSSSFFTSAVQHRMLREGVTLGNKLGLSSDLSEFAKQADNILCFMQSYWNPNAGYMTSNTGGGRSGIDSNTNLASIHTFDPDAGCDPVTFQPCSDKALASLKVYVDSFRSIWPINSGVAINKPVATGRYPEDVYYNGNPWYLSTFGVAEQLYYALSVWNSQKSLDVTSISLPFFQRFSPNVGVGTYKASASDNVFDTLTNAIHAFADGFIAVNAQYTPADGSLTEQFSKTDGTPVSAVHLTWSYASALTAFAARKGDTVKGWGAKGLVVPGVCNSNLGPQVTVTFNVEMYSKWGENIFVTGSTDALKLWSPDNAIPLQYNLIDNRPIWIGTANLTANQDIQYKYISKYNGQITWESDPNRFYHTPPSGQVALHDVWR